MPNGFWYARGKTHEFAEAIPSSAFSKGDLLQLDSTLVFLGLRKLLMAPKLQSLELHYQAAMLVSTTGFLILFPVPIPSFGQAFKAWMLPRSSPA